MEEAQDRRAAQGEALGVADRHRLGHQLADHDRQEGADREGEHAAGDARWQAVAGDHRLQRHEDALVEHEAEPEAGAGDADLHHRQVLLHVPLDAREDDGAAVAGAHQLGDPARPRAHHRELGEREEAVHHQQENEDGQVDEEHEGLSLCPRPDARKPPRIGAPQRL